MECGGVCTLLLFAALELLWTSSSGCWAGLNDVRTHPILLPRACDHPTII